jgi:CHAT domain-containing protein
LRPLRKAIARWEQASKLAHKRLAELPVSYKIRHAMESWRVDASLTNAYVEMAERDGRYAVSALRNAMVSADRTRVSLLDEGMVRSGQEPHEVEDTLRKTESHARTSLKIIDSTELGYMGRFALRAELAEGWRRRRTEREELLQLSGTASSADMKDLAAPQSAGGLEWKHLQRLANEAGASTAFISMMPLDDHMVVLVFRDGWNRPLAVRHRFGFKSRLKTVRQLRRQLHTTSPPPDLTWHRDYARLLRKTMKKLGGLDRVVISAEQPELLIPWSLVLEEAVRSEHPPRAVPDVVMTPTLNVLSSLRGHRREQNDGALVIGTSAPARSGWAAREARIVSDLLGVEPLIGSSVTKNAILDRLHTSRLAHFACHATFDPRAPLDSGLLLPDGMLTAREVATLQLRTDMVVLSGCGTGLHASLGGNELGGLPSAFIMAGARSVLVSLWPVLERSTVEFMTMFYKAHLAGEDKARAIRSAAQSVAEHRKWSHPHYWAPFVLFGDWE